MKNAVVFFFRFLYENLFYYYQKQTYPNLIYTDKVLYKVYNSLNYSAESIKD